MRIILILAFIFTWSFGFTQIANCYEDEFIIQLNKETSITSFLAGPHGNLNLEWDRSLHQGSNIHLIRTNSTISATATLSLLSRDNDIRYVMQNCIASPRGLTPDDPLFTEQWGLEKIQASELWELGVGDVTPNGDTIVVAVLDEGFFTTHEDLTANIWVNKGEIPGDNIDNDGNGYTDDYQGLNLLTQNDQHPTGTNSLHGTAVSGIIGARGNNGKGVTGVSWGVKLMLLSKTQSIDRTIEALYYAYEQRKKYNLTNGAEGAFVVATNYSQGIDFVICDSLPLLNQAYDSLGQVGILSVGATTNIDINVDNAGDIPSTCQSDFLISVTNTDINDDKVISAGFGPINVDIGAPGGTPMDGTLTSYPDDRYESFRGTSGATPHVAGAIALLYSTASDRFLEVAKSNPAEAALSVKNALLDGVDKIPSLNSLSVSEGRLNVWKAFLALDLTYRNNTGNFLLKNAYPNPTADIINLEFQSDATANFPAQIFDAMGRIVSEFEIPGYALEKAYSLDLSALSAGVYYLKVKNDEEVITIAIFTY